MAEPTTESEKDAAFQTVKDLLAAFSGGRPPWPETRALVNASSFSMLAHPNNLRAETLEELLAHTEKIVGDLFDRGETSYALELTEPKPEVWYFDDIAAVWAGVDHRFSGKSVGAGVVLVSLVRRGGKWILSGMADIEYAADDPVLGGDGPSQEDDPAIQQTVQTFMDYLTERNWDGMLSLLVPGGGATASRANHPDRPDLWITKWPGFIQTLREITEKLPPGTSMEEKIFDVEVRRYGEFAFLWSPFIVERNGEHVSGGTNIFSLLKQGDKWLISGCQDTNSPVKLNPYSN